MSKENLFPLLPKVDQLMEGEAIKDLEKSIARRHILDATREEIDRLRGLIQTGIGKQQLEEEIFQIEAAIIQTAKNKDAYKLRRVVNATGVVIHTNIGRSLINEEIMDNIKEVATNYSNLEFDLATGKRGLRYDHLEEIIREITGAEAAIAVNNNAAAVMLVLSTLAKGKESIVSRGELIEIGGSFRIPDVMEESGSKLVEVGTTNKTHLRDYERAINEETGVLLKVHTSNYRILGFTEDVSAQELKVLADKHDIPLVEDLGSGVLLDLSKYGLDYEPTVQESLENGIDIVTFSGDKLLGGPQVGIIVGKKEYIEEMKSNPLTRAFRIDKFTISALEATFRYYLDEEKAIEEIPTLNMITMPIEKIEKKAQDLEKVLKDLNLDIDIKIQDSYSEVGGGSLPLTKLDTKCLVLSLDKGIDQLERRLRGYKIPIISRLYRDQLYLDPRTIRDFEYEIIGQALKEALEGMS